MQCSDEPINQAMEPAMNTKSNLLDDRLNTLLVVAALVMAVFGDVDGLLDMAQAASSQTSVVVATAAGPAALV